MGDQRFPFRGDDAATRLRANEVLRGIMPMVRRQIAVLDTQNLDQQARDVIFTDVMSKLWEVCLPKYEVDRTAVDRGAKVSTFLFRCTTRLIYSEFRRLSDQARSKRKMVTISPDAASRYSSADQFLDTRVEKLAQDIIRHPTEYLNPAYARVLTARIEHPHMSVGDLARLLGYIHPRSLSTALRRIRDLLTDLGVETYVFAIPQSPDSRRTATESVSDGNQTVT